MNSIRIINNVTHISEVVYVRTYIHKEHLDSSASIARVLSLKK